MKLVALVAEHRGFAPAARVMGIDPSTVSRSVAQTEAQLGLRLFQRSTRVLSLTDEGAAYLRRVVPLLEELDHAHEAARAAGAKPSGTLRMTASVAFAHEVVVPHLGAFQAQFPDITVELLPTDATLDLTANAIDLALRLAPGPKGNLISTRLMATQYRVCASPQYLSRHGALANPKDLEGRDVLRFALPEYRTRWRFRSSDGAPFEVPVSGRVIIGNALSLRQAARDGLGPVLLADWLVAGDLAAGQLVDLFPAVDCTATEFDTAAWMLYPSRSYLPGKVRAMIDFLRAAVRGAG